MKAKCAVLLVGMLLLATTRAGATTYAVSEFAGDSTNGVGIGGSITTDGTLGPIGAANIVDWNLIGTAIVPGATTTFFDSTPSNSLLVTSGTITATANALTLGLGPNGDLQFDLQIPSPPIGTTTIATIEFSVLIPRPGSVPDLKFSVCGLPPGAACSFGAFASDLTFADGKVIETASATPLPATLPLFATGLGGLGLLGWRRKRKAQAVA